MIRRLVVLSTLAVALVGTAAPPASAAPRWAPASTATIHPGVRTVTGGNPCRANFVFYDAKYVYLGQSASCSGLIGYGPCPISALPLGTPVKIEGASRPGTIVYNSWITMERAGQTSGPTCGGNDFALVRIHSADVGRVNPSMPFWGGPTAAGARSNLGDRVYSSGNPATYCWQDNCRPRASANELAPVAGIDTGTSLMPNVPWGGLRPEAEMRGWIHYIHTVPPGMALERGSAVLDVRGRALGTVGWPAYDASDRVRDLTKTIAYMKAKTTLDAIQLATGTTRFAARL